MLKELEILKLGFLEKKRVNCRLCEQKTSTYFVIYNQLKKLYGLLSLFGVVIWCGVSSLLFIVLENQILISFYVPHLLRIFLASQFVVRTVLEDNKN